MSELQQIVQAIEYLAAKMEGFDAKLDGFDAKLDGFGTKLDGFATKMDALDTRVNTLEAKVDALTSRVDALTTRVNNLAGELKDLRGEVEQVNRRMDHLEHLVVAVKESLEREMHAGFSEVNGRFDTQATRLDRQGALIQLGSRWTNRMNGWSEKIDAAFERKDREIGDLRGQIDRLGHQEGEHKEGE